MATIKATVRRIGDKIKTNKRGEALVYIQYVHNGRNFTENTGVSIPPENWRGDKDQNNPVGGEVQGRKPKNDTIKAIRRKIEHAVAELQYRNIDPTVEAVKELLAKKEDDKSIDITFLFDKYIEDSETTKAKITVDGIKRSRNHFFRFCKHQKKTPKLLDINFDFYNSYVKYLLVKRGMTNNSVGKEIKTLKAFLHYCRDNGYQISEDVRKFKVFKERTVIIFLTEEELDGLYHFDFSSKPRLERVRDVFVFNCYTGLRWSDLSRLKRTHIEGNIIRLRQHKNKNDTLIPLTPRSASILEKYGHELPLISEQNMNSYIKEACQLAGISQAVEMATYKGGKKLYKMVPKYQLISVHTGIKSFISLAVKKGVPVKVISQITGKSQEVINRHYLGAEEKSIVEWMGRAFGTVE